MINLLILYILSDKELTMYKISKYIGDYFAGYTKPSFGAIKPALKVLEEKGFIDSRKALSEGGKQYGYYRMTQTGRDELKKLILTPLTKNPTNFYSIANIKLSCASILTREEAAQLFFDVKSTAMEHKYQTEKILNDEYTPNTFHGRVTLDNAITQYENFISFVESLEKENGKN